ncbi:MAG: hypothetical protein MHM6MM_004677 [Cercozoa sp. M6MM]
MVQAGDVIGGFRVLRPLGTGSFGTTFVVAPETALVRGKHRQHLVLKTVQLGGLAPAARARALDEVRVLGELHHPNIVAYVDSFVGEHRPDRPEEEQLHIVMEFCSGGDLGQLIRNAKQEQAKHLEASDREAAQRSYFSEARVMRWFSQVCRAMRRCHHARILHRDLKSQNVFLTEEDCVKLGDFGIARRLDHTAEMAQTVVGTPYSMSPEVCESKPYSYKSDVWSLGCLLYELLVLKHPFQAPNLLNLVWRIVQVEPPKLTSFRSDLSDEVVDLVNSLLVKNPDERPSVDEIMQRPIVLRALVTTGKKKQNRRRLSLAVPGEMPMPSLVTSNKTSPASKLQSEKARSFFDVPQLADDSTSGSPASMGVAKALGSGPVVSGPARHRTRSRRTQSMGTFAFDPQTIANQQETSAPEAESCADLSQATPRAADIIHSLRRMHSEVRERVGPQASAPTPDDVHEQMRQQMQARPRRRRRSAIGLKGFMHHRQTSMAFPNSNLNVLLESSSPRLEGTSPTEDPVRSRASSRESVPSMPSLLEMPDAMLTPPAHKPRSRSPQSKSSTLHFHSRSESKTSPESARKAAGHRRRQSSAGLVGSPFSQAFSPSTSRPVSSPSHVHTPSMHMHYPSPSPHSQRKSPSLSRRSVSPTASPCASPSTSPSAPPRVLRSRRASIRTHSLKDLMSRSVANSSSLPSSTNPVAAPSVLSGAEAAHAPPRASQSTSSLRRML